MKSVELHAAFTFDCDECGAEQFARGVTISPESIDPDDMPTSDTEEAEAIREWMAAGGGGSWMTKPAVVRCKSCWATFRTEEP